MTDRLLLDKDRQTLEYRANRLRKMSARDKAKTWVNACRATDELLLKGIRLRQPGFSPREANLELLCLKYGDLALAAIRRNPDWSPEPLNSDIQSIVQFVSILKALGFEYHLGGSFASVIHGEPRQTRDVDVIVRFLPWRTQSFMDAMQGDFDLPTTRDAIIDVARNGGSFTAIHRETGFEMDVIIADDGPFDHEEFAGCKKIELGDPPVEILVKSAEHIVLRKLLWYRQGNEVSERQWTDAAGVVRVNQASLDLESMRKWADFLKIRDLLERLLTPSD